MNTLNPSTAGDRGKGVELLSVRIGDQNFALDIMAVREIKGWTASVALAHAPDYIKGMINLRGSVVAIVDLANRLGLPSKEPGAGSVVVVVEMQGRVVGLLVDAVNDIVTVTDEMKQAIPETGNDASRTFISSLFTLDNSINSIISIPAIMPEGSDLGAMGAA